MFDNYENTVFMMVSVMFMGFNDWLLSKLLIAVPIHVVRLMLFSTTLIITTIG